jgi:hypothetical protein
MRGLTPVIAIILILVLAVFAVGGFSLYYRAFVRDTDDTSREAQSELFKQTGAQLEIESVEDSKIYVRNVGTTEQEIAKIGIFIDGRPLLVSTDSEKLRPNEWAEFQILEPANCNKDYCTLQISGIDTSKRPIDSEKFNCTQNPECHIWESCYCRTLYFSDTFLEDSDWVDESSGGASFSISNSKATVQNGYGGSYKYTIPPYNATGFFVRMKASSPDGGSCIVSTDSLGQNTFEVSPAVTPTIYNLSRSNSNDSVLLSKVNLTATNTCVLEFLEIVKS